MSNPDVTAASNDMDHYAGILAALVSRFEAAGYLELPSALEEDLENYRAAVAKFEVALAALRRESA